MEPFLLTILIIIVLLLYNRFGNVKRLLEQQRDDMGHLRADVLRLRDGVQPVDKPVTSVTASQPAPVPPVAQPIVVPVFRPEPTPDLEPVAQFSMPPAPLPGIRPTLQPTPVSPESTFREPEPLKPSFIRRFLNENPDLEKFIGENLINKIGIAILVAGIGYFVKFAIDQQWINEVGRVLIGFVAGGLLLGVAHWLRRTFGAFSSVLVAGGLSVMYFTVAIAFSDYKLFSQTAAFGIMAVITASSILLAIAYNRVELAVMSLVGGFATPFMVSTGQGNYAVLFSYLLILDVGMLVLAYFKKWSLVHWVAYGFTVLLYGSWLSADVIGQKDAPYAGALLFGTLFYTVFMAMNLIYNLKNQLKFSTTEVMLLLSNTAFYYAAGMVILAHVAQGAYQGLFTGLLAVLNFGYATFLFRRNAVDRTLIYLMIGLVITFASLTIPVQLDGNFITMFWALEAVLLLWLAQRSGLYLVASGSVIVLILMLISLSMDWLDLYGVVAVPTLPVVFNKAFVTSIVALVGLLATHRLLTRQTEPFSLWLGKVDPIVYRRLLTYVIVVVGYLAGLYELDYQLIAAYDFGPNRTILLGTYNLSFAIGLLLAVGGRRVSFLTGDVPVTGDLAINPAPTRSRLLQVAGLGLLALLGYLLLYGPSVLSLVDNYYRGAEASFVGFPVHYLSLTLAIVLLILLSRYRSLLEPLPAFVNRFWPWFLGISIVYIASWELFAHAVVFHFSDADIARQPTQVPAVTERFDELLTQTNKVGLPILWGICAFAFMYVGLIRRNRVFRILSLSLFGLTLIKLFFYDIRGISEGGRIAAFISLGVLLLIISFMYQRIKKLILVSDTTPPTPQS